MKSETRSAEREARNQPPWKIRYLPDNGGGPRAVLTHRQSGVSQIVSGSDLGEAAVGYHQFQRALVSACWRLGFWDAFAC